MNNYRFHVIEESLSPYQRVVGGRKRGRTLLSNALVVNVFTSEIVPANILIGDGLILGVGKDYNDAEEIYDLGYSYVVPGLIDGHMHVESSMVTPPRLAEALLPLGTTTLVADPHEIASILGIKGVEYVLESSDGLPLNLFVTAPSFSPLPHLETSGATLSPAEVERLLRHPRVVGLGEVMDYAGVLTGDPQVSQKIRAARSAGKPVDGHAPRLMGPALDSYIAAGISSDHECTTPQEALARLRGGAMLMIREGSMARNMEDLLGAIGPTTSHRCMLVSDDMLPVDLMREGHVDHMVRKAIRLGISPTTAIRMATINAALHFRLPRIGAVAPGYAADLIVVEDLEDLRAEMVFKDGRLAAREGELLIAVGGPRPVADAGRINMAPISRDHLTINIREGGARVIRINPRQMPNTGTVETLSTGGGAALPDAERDLLKLVVVERHRASGNVGLAIVKGFGLRRGALASSVAHDCHNIIAVGADDEDILCAIGGVARMGGGLAAAAGGSLLECLPLPVAGLMSEEPVRVVSENLSSLHQVARELGTRLDLPFTTLSFLSLPVIPELRLTDKGLVDVATQKLVPLQA